MRQLKLSSVCFLGGFVMFLASFGVRHAMHSSFFTLERMEVILSQVNPPLDRVGILRLIAVPLGKVSLFDLDLNSIEKSLLSQDWIREVKFKKSIFHTLVVTVNFREPKAVIQTSQGTLRYVDEEGKIFGTFSLLQQLNLPYLSGFSHQNSEKIRVALLLLLRWENSPLSVESSISSVYWELERGFRILLTYSLGLDRSTQARTMIDIGQEIDETLDGKLFRLSHIIEYLKSNSIAVHQVWMDAGKKVVVKTVQGS